MKICNPALVSLIDGSSVVLFSAQEMVGDGKIAVTFVSYHSGADVDCRATGRRREHFACY